MMLLLEPLLSTLCVASKEVVEKWLALSIFGLISKGNRDASLTMAAAGRSKSVCVCGSAINIKSILLKFINSVLIFTQAVLIIKKMYFMKPPYENGSDNVLSKPAA